MSTAALTPAQRDVLARIDAAFGSSGQNHDDRRRALQGAVAGWERKIAELATLATDHAAWRAAMAVKNPCALAVHKDARPTLRRQIERYRRWRDAALVELRGMTEVA